MKHQLKLILLLLSCIAISYSACTKSSITRNSSTVSPKVVSSQVALNLKQILYGEYGSFSIADGVDMPVNMDIGHKGRLKIQSTNDGPKCGFKIDTAFQFSLDASDTAKFDIWNRIKYEVLCTSGVLSGVSVYDSLNVSATSANYTIISKSGETLVLKRLVPGNKNSQLSLSGSLNVYANVQPKKASEKPTTGTYNFTLTALIIDPAKNGDVISGSATFATKGSGAGGIWDYKGTIIFLGDHKVKITINGSSYTYDLQTGLEV
jgi:hypothetical protein